MATHDDKELQRYFDGELSPRHARKVRERIAASAEDRGRITALSTMQEALRQASARCAEQADFGDLWAKVRRGIERGQAPSLGARLALWTRRFAPVLAAGAAAILVAVIFVLQSGERPPARNDVVIESLDVGAEAVSTIFTIADEAGGTGETTVIWVTETSPETSREMSGE